MDGQPQHASCRVTSDGFKLIDDPSFDLICKFVEVDVFLSLVIRFAVNLNVLSGELTGKLDVQSALSDCQ